MQVNESFTKMRVHEEKQQEIKSLKLRFENTSAKRARKIQSIKLQNTFAAAFLRTFNASLPACPTIAIPQTSELKCAKQKHQPKKKKLN